LDIRDDEVREAANADRLFAHAARQWTCRLQLKIGDTRHIVDVLDGHVRRFEPTEDLFEASDITLGGSESDWDQLLRPVPVPFYQDFIGAWFNHGFEMSGDLRSLFAHYWALLRLLDIMREVRSNGEGGEL
jgi:hypothetical protein